MKEDEIAFGEHRFGDFRVSIQACVFDERPASEVSFFEVLVVEDRGDGLLYYVDLHERFGWFKHLGTFERKLQSDDLVEHNARVDALFYKLAQPTWRLGRPSIVRLAKMCADETKRMEKERKKAGTDKKYRPPHEYAAGPVMDPAAAAAHLMPAAAPDLRGLADLLDQTEPWDAPSIRARVDEWLVSRGAKLKDVAQPARVAITGRSASPDLFQSMEVLGREKTTIRLRRAAHAVDPATDFFVMLHAVLALEVP